MGLLDLGLHLSEQRGLLCPEKAKQPSLLFLLSLPFPLPFSFTSLFPLPFLFSLQILLRGMDPSFLLWLSQPGAAGLPSLTLKGLEQGAQPLTLPTYLPIAKAVDKSHKETLPRDQKRWSLRSLSLPG